MYAPLSITELESVSIEISAAARMFWLSFLRQYRPSIGLEQSKLSALPQFAAEVFHRMYYDFDPSFKNVIAPEHQWAKSLHDALSQNERLRGLAFRHSGNPVAAGLATVDVVDVLLKQLPEPESPIKDLSELRRQARQASRDGDQETLEKLQAEGTAAAESAIAYAAILAEDGADKVESSLEEAAVLAEETVEAVEQQFEMLGMSWGNEPGSPTQVSFEERLALAKQLESQVFVQEILDRAGKFLETALQQRRKAPVSAGYGELVGITTGANLGRLLPSELGKLSSPSQRPLFYKGFTERTLFEYDLQAPKEKGKGPIVMCIDTSDSMSGASELWAKGLAIALARLAAKDNRDMAIIPFSNAPGRVVELPAGDRNWDKLLRDVIGLNMRGGTNFEKPLAVALEIIEKAANLRQADIVFLTDGAAAVSDRFKQEFKTQQDKQQISLLSIFVGSAQPGSSLKDISDSIWNVKDVTSDKDQEKFLGLL